MTTFDGSTLFISARSPFARRVRVAFHENGVRFQEKVFDVFQPNPELWKANPLARVPALVLSNGRVLIDSTLILQAFYEAKAGSFVPESEDARLEVSRFSAIALGLCEKTVEYYLETLRPKERQDQELFEEIEDIFARSLAVFESQVERTEFLVPNDGRPTQADFDLGVALGYLQLRHPLLNGKPWRELVPSSAKFYDRMNSRPSFQKSLPG